MLRCRDLVAGRVRRAMSGMVSELSDTLCERAISEGGDIAASPHFDAVREMQLRRNELALRFETHFARLFDATRSKPLQPERLHEAFRRACEDTGSAPVVQEALLRIFERFMDREFAGICQEAGRVLETGAAGGDDAPRNGRPAPGGRQRLERELGGRAIPHFVRAFLFDQWALLLDRLAAEQGEESREWLRAMSAAEELIAAVQDFRDGEGSRRALWQLPGLVHRLRRGMRRIPMSIHEQMLFLRTLRAYHLRMAGLRSSVGVLDS